MLAEGVNALQRRAENLIWAAAGEYGFEPEFLAMQTTGSPDFYMNCIVGYVRKWYGPDITKRLFSSWSGDARQGMLDDLAWLALENAAYERELACRPALEQLRREHAGAFFAMDYQRSRQEWMAKNQLVYTMQSARWKSVLGQRLPVMAPWEKGLYQALACPGELDSAQLEAHIRDCFGKYLQFDGVVRRKVPLRLHFDEKWAPVLTKLLPTEIVRTDELAIGRSGRPGQGNLVQAARAVRGLLRGNERAAEDRAYIESCFGRCIWPERELAQAEGDCCTGDHLGCHLWVTRGSREKDAPVPPAAQRLYEQAAEQARANREAYGKDAELYQSTLLRLTEQIQNSLMVHRQPELESGRAGTLDGTRVWRAPILQDGRVFLHREQESRPGFAVDLLLDGSASRLHCQEIIAAQGYILAESLERCGIPVRVSSFCSLRGYTVVRILKEYQDKSRRRIFDYFAAGWNRDGLALRAMGRLMKEAPGDKHLLILLTDASPDDSHKIPPTGKIPLSREYDGQAGIDDTARQVRLLRQAGIRVAAVFMGENEAAEAARTIYGRDLARIRRMDELAQAAGKLIREEIRELSG